MFKVRTIRLITKQEVDKVLNEGIREIDRRMRINLYEEFGISDDVRNVCLEIERYVIDKKNDFLMLDSGNRVEKKFDFFGKKLEVVYYVFKCKDRNEEAELVSNEYFAENASSAYLYQGRIAFVHIPVIFVGGELDTPKLYDDLQHEVSHVYQQYRSGDMYKIDEYLPNKSFLYSPNECERNLSRIVYLCYPPEQDAFVNGMYGYVMKSLANHEYPVDKTKISAYRELQNLYRCYDFVQKNRNTEEMANAIEILKNNGVPWNINKYLRRASEGIKEFEQKIRRTLQKCQKDAKILGYNIMSRGRADWLF